MTDIPLAALILAGYTLAHATWSVSDTKPDELLVPLVVVEAGGRTGLRRYEAPTQVEAIARGKRDYPSFSAANDAWAFAWEGARRIPSNNPTAQDVIVVEFWGKGMKAPATLAQRFERASNGRPFRLIGEPLLTVDGRQQLDSVTAAPIVAQIVRGVATHPEVKRLWATWRVPSTLEFRP